MINYWHLLVHLLGSVSWAFSIQIWYFARWLGLIFILYQNVEDYALQTCFFFFRTLIKLLTSFTCSVLEGWLTLKLHLQLQLGLHRLQKVSIKVQMANSLPPTGLFIADDNLRTTAMPRWIFEVNGCVSSKQETQWIQGDQQLTVNHFLVLVYLYWVVAMEHLLTFSCFYYCKDNGQKL